MIRRGIGVCMSAALLALLLVGPDMLRAQEPPRGDQPGQRPEGGRPEGGPGRRGPGGRGFGGPGGFSGPGGGGGDMLGLLMSEKVQQELEVIDDQKGQITKLAEAARENRPNVDFQSLRDMPEEERRQKMEELGAQMRERAKENEGKLADILLPHQMDRLKQLSVRARGLRALGDPTVAEELGLSEDQKQQIIQVQQEVQEQMRGMFGRPGEGGEANREGMRERFEQMQKDNEAKILGVLTKEQQGKFEDMKGAEFEFERPAGFGPPGEGGRPRGPEGRGPEGRGSREGGGPRPEDEDRGPGNRDA